MFKRFFGSKRESDSKQLAEDEVFEIEEEEDRSDVESTFLQNLKTNMSRMIAYTHSADVTLQREVAEMLANEAVNSDRQVQIVEYGGLNLLVPLTKSSDEDVQRLAVHSLANLSVNSNNQVLLAEQGAIELLVEVLGSTKNEIIQRQAAKAIANMGVNQDNKLKIGQKGGISKLVDLARSPNLQVKIEAVAALGNLAVNDVNEVEIVEVGALEILEEAAAMALRFFTSNKGRRDHNVVKERSYWEELAAQSARCIRNLTVNPDNRQCVVDCGLVPILREFGTMKNDRIAQQSLKAVRNLNSVLEKKADGRQAERKGSKNSSSDAKAEAKSGADNGKEKERGYK